MTRCTRTPRFLTVVTVGVVAVGIASGLAPSAVADPVSSQGVTLVVDVVGDSYAAGDGISGTYLDPADQRNQSRVAPALQALSRIAQENPGLTVDANLVASAGAVTADFFYPQRSGELIVNAAQRDQVRPTAQVVIVGFGGSDVQLANVLGVAVPSNNTKPGDVDAKIRGVSGLLDLSGTDQAYLDQAAVSAPGQVPTLTARVLQVLSGVAQRAPGARIAVTTYPIAVNSQDPHSVSRINARDLTTVQKFMYDLNEAIVRAVRICQCATLVDMSRALIGHEAYTTDSAFTELNPDQTQRQDVRPNDTGASLMANPIATDLAKMLGFQAPRTVEGTVTEPANIQIQAGVSDVDGDLVADTDDAAPTDPNRGHHHDRTPDDRGPLNQGLPPSNKPGHGRDDNDRDRDDNDRTPDAGPISVGVDDGVTVQAGVGPVHASVGPLVAGVETVQTDLGAVDASVGPLAANAVGVDPSGSVPTTLAEAAVPVTTTPYGPVSPIAAQAGQQSQTPPARTYDLPSVPVPEFGPPGLFGESPSRDITVQQLKAADQLTQFTQDNNPVTADSAGTASAKGKVGKVGDKQAQSAKVVRNAEDGTMDLEVTTREGLDYDLGLGKYSDQQLDRTGFNLSPESTRNFTDNDTLPDFGTMMPGDTITRTPALPSARATEYGVGRNIGKYAEAQVGHQYSEAPTVQYSVSALGDGKFTVTYGEATAGRSRTTFSLGKGPAKIGANTDDTVSSFKGVAVDYDANTPGGLAGLRSAIEGLEQGVQPTIAPGTYYNSVTVDKAEGTGYGSGKAAGKNIPTAPEVESKIASHRDGLTTRTTTLMKSVDGTPEGAEPVGQSTVETTRLGTGSPLGDVGHRVGPVAFAGNSVPTKVTVRSFTDGPLHTNEVTFTANGQKHTLTQGDLNQRARDLAATDPETVRANPVLSDLAAGVGFRATALTDPPNDMWSSLGLAITNMDINQALTALVTPPVPEHNPFTAPVPERRPTDPPMPERRPQDPPLPERRADVLDPMVQEASLTELDTDAIFGEGFAEENTDSLDDSAMDSAWTGVSPEGYSVPGVDDAEAITSNVPGTVVDNGFNDGYSVPGVDDATADTSSVPGTTVDSGYSDGYSVPGTDDATASTTGSITPTTDTGYTDSYSVPGVDADTTTTSDTTTSDTTTDAGYSGSDSTDTSSSYSSDTDSGDTTSYGGDSSTGYGGDSSSYGGDSSTSYGGDSSSYGGGDSSSYGGSSSSYGGGSDSSSGDSSSSTSSSSYGGGGSVGGGDGGGW